MKNLAVFIGKIRQQHNKLQLLLLLLPSLGMAQTRVLVLGDSHMVGQFGDHFHVNLHKQGKFEMLSVSIGGSGSANFLHTLTNFCCGYMVRQARPGDSLTKDKKIPVLAGSYVIGGERILENYRSRLDTVLRRFQPTIVIIELGSNLVNEHQKLLTLIHKHTPSAAVYWIGPYARQMVQYRIAEIEKVCTPLVNRCMFIHSDDVIGKPGMLTYHFVGDDAQRWADSVAVRVSRLYKQHMRYAISFNRAIRFSLVATRICSPLVYACYRKMARYCPGEGWLSHAILAKNTVSAQPIVK